MQDTYGRIRMYHALLLKQSENVDIPSERAIYRVMEETGLNHQPRRKPNGITKADREDRKSEELIKRDFRAEGCEQSLEAYQAFIKEWLG